MWRRGGRLIWRSLRAHPVPHAIAMFGAFVFVLAAVGGAWILRAVTDDLIIPAFDDGEVSGSEVWGVVALLVGVSILRGIGVITRRWFLIMAEMRTQRDWRRGLLWHYLDLPLRFHRSKPTGELLAHADIDVQAATMVLKPLAFSVSVVLLVAVAVVSILLVHPLLALVAVLMFPVLAVLSRGYTAKVEQPAADVQQRVGEVSSVVHESFDGALIVKTLGREREESERMRLVSELLRRDRVEVGRLRASFEPVIDALPNVGIVALLVVGSWLISRGSATPGDLVLVISLFGLIATPLRIFGFFLEEMPRSVVSLERVDGILSQPIEVSSGTRRIPPGPVAVSVSRLCVAHDEHQVLNDVSLEIMAGETVALVGATGSGKSTLLETIAGLIDREDGSIRLDGVPMEDLASGALSDAVALVFQDTFLFADTIQENVSLGQTDQAGVDAALRIAGAQEFVARMPYGSRSLVGERGVTLSGGQRQRIALARALVRRPGLLLLDDATSAVDPIVEARILESLRADLAATLVIVAQRFSTIALADRVVYLADGAIVATGSHTDLLLRGDYRSLVSTYEQAAPT